jgi:hypothetical protein
MGITSARIAGASTLARQSLGRATAAAREVAWNLPVD